MQEQLFNHFDGGDGGAEGVFPRPRVGTVFYKKLVCLTQQDGQDLFTIESDDNVLEVVFQTKIETIGVVGARVKHVLIGPPILFAVLGSGLALQQGVQVSLVILRHGVVLDGERKVGPISHQIRKDLVFFDDPEILHVVLVKPLEEMGHGQETRKHVVTGQVEPVLGEEHQSTVNFHPDLVQLKDEPSGENTTHAVVVSDASVIGL
jgi:hypothetical protein